MTLTEQWKKGELKEGWYYINDSQIDYKYRKHSSVDFFITPHEDIKEVLAPVPSYEEWRRTFHYAGKYEHEYTSCVMEYENLKQENQQLKEQLEIAVKALKDMARQCDLSWYQAKAEQTLKDIEELDK